MKMLLPTAVIWVVAARAYSQVLFFPGNQVPKLEAGTLQIPGYFAENSQPPLVISENSERPLISAPQQFPDTQARYSALGSSKLESTGLLDSNYRAFGNLENRVVPTNQQPVDTSFLSSGASFNIPNPFQRVITVQENKIEYKLVPPLCVACTCLIGKKLCTEVGGVYAVTTGKVGAVDCAVGACVLPAPSTMSACDPNCKKFVAGTCDPAAAATTTNTGCVALTGDDVVQCKTPCAELAAGEVVECSARYINTGVIAAVPPLCGPNARLRREANNSKVPTIVSSQEITADRQQRLLKPFGNFGGARVVPVTVTSTSTVTGAATAIYVPQGNCLASDLPTCRF